MRKRISIVAIAVFATKFIWRFSDWISEWAGRFIGVRGVTSSYEAFVESYVGMYLAEGGLAGGSWSVAAHGHRANPFWHSLCVASQRFANPLGWRIAAGPEPKLTG
jgi:hypothetical protein